MCTVAFTINTKDSPTCVQMCTPQPLTAKIPRKQRTSEIMKICGIIRKDNFRFF